VFTANIDPPWDAAAWREQARAALLANVAPEEIIWNAGAQGGLLDGANVIDQPAVRDAPSVAKDFLSLASLVLCHRDPHRHALLYCLLWRIANGERELLARATDPDMHRALELAKSVRRDSHEMKAFVRFRAVPGQDNAFVAWFEPDHFIVDRIAPFFMRRFAGMRWAILTPYRSALWDGESLTFGDGRTRADAPSDDAQESLWRTYYASIFNPARLNTDMMRQEMAQKYWKLLPEAHLFPTLIREANERTHAMRDRTPEPTRRRIPQTLETPAIVEPGLRGLRQAARACRNCELWQPATQTVFGEGPEDARIMLIGEQPGDEEDLVGRPFVGPSGRLLDRALSELGLDRSQMYVTNAVKHFRFEPRGKRRLHRNPERSHERACSVWLEGELTLVKPNVVVCLGASAARAMFGFSFRLTDERGQWQTTAGGKRAFATVHPSSILRTEAAHRDDAYAAFVNDLRLLSTLTGFS
jgi:probable DNA metabolism protein